MTKRRYVLPKSRKHDKYPKRKTAPYVPRKIRRRREDFFGHGGRARENA